MDAKEVGNVIVVVGETRDELGGSHFYKLNGQLGANVPRVDLQAGPKIIQAVAEAISDGLVRSCHDCSEGGLAVALAEMAFAGGLGMEINLGGVPVARDVGRNYQILFSESPSRLVLEVHPDDIGKLAKILGNVRFAEIGKVTDGTRLVIRDRGNRAVIDAEIADLKETWQKPLRW